jgi:hypothetical protein
VNCPLIWLPDLLCDDVDPKILDKKDDKLGQNWSTREETIKLAIEQVAGECFMFFVECGVNM